MSWSFFAVSFSSNIAVFNLLINYYLKYMLLKYVTLDEDYVYK
jgi:hypothetical protein